MKFQELIDMTIVDSADAIRRKVISPVELVEAELAHIQNIDQKLNSFLNVFGDEAIMEAKNAERKILGGEYLGVLHGIPIGLKDLYYTKNHPTTAGSKVIKDFVPLEDATVVTKFKTAGAIILGKLNMDEFARGATNENLHYGVCRNPWDLERSPGGSSGGSGAAVSARLIKGALGSDTGGSIRIPASLCGIVGLKPTYGLVSIYGVVPLGWTCDHVGPMTRTVADSAEMLKVIAGEDPKDPGTRKVDIPDYKEALGKSVKGLKIATLKEFSNLSVDPDVSKSFHDAIKILQELGISVEEISIPFSLYATAISDIIIGAESASFHEPYLKSVPEKYSARLRDRNELGFSISAVSYIKAQRARTILYKYFEEAFNQVDAIISPTCAITAPKFGQTTYKVDSIEESMLGALAKFTRLFNVSGNPSISVPCGTSSEGLPIGLQIVGKAFDEAGILNIAHAYETASAWDQRPTLVSS